MKRKSANLFAFLFVFVFATALFYSCQKSVDVKPNQLTSVSASTSSDASVFPNASIDNLIIREETYQMYMAMDPGGFDYAENKSGCPVSVTYEPSIDVYPHKVIVDYGTGCTDNFGITRSGKILFSYTAPTTELHSKVITNYDNFYIDGIKLEGKFKISQNRTPTDSTTNYRMTYKDRKSIFPDGDYIIVNGHRRAIKEGGGKIDFPHGTFRLNGTLDYTQSFDGVLTQYSTTTDELDPLWYVGDCIWIVQGTLHYAYTDGSTQHLDYGDGVCDDQAVLTDRDGNVKTITLR
ncbi:MAG TPA: hypothetical protein PL045_11750 [Chitinophagaceae bacterium]|nr:hypothetical protein [Chitinophagaceae bacterium]